VGWVVSGWVGKVSKDRGKKKKKGNG
jgi:hypothetical protein